MFLIEEGNINRYILRNFPHSMGYIKACNLPVCVISKAQYYDISAFCLLCLCYSPPSFFSAYQTVYLFEKGNVNRYFLWDISGGVGYFPTHSLPFCVSIMVLLQCDLGCHNMI